MTTHHLIDPETLPLLELMPTRDFDDAVLVEIRGMTDHRFAFLGAPPILPEIKTFPGPDGPLELYWYDPAPGTKHRPAMLHVHGGGMIIGSAATMQHGPAGVAAALGVPVASVEYRLAPEHPFPAPQKDCYAALEWLAGQAGALGVDPARIGIMGESAGGGLAAAVALMARDRGGPNLAAQVLTYPMLDHRTGGADCPYRNHGTGEFVWTRASNQFGWGALRGDYAADDARRGWFSPALADDLTGLPPTWIGTGSLDLFLDENLAYVRRLIDAGVPTELHVYPGGVHAFNAVASAGIATAFNRDMLSATARLLKLTQR